MKQNLFLVTALLICSIAFAETSLVVYPMSEAEQATAFSTIGYVKLRNDSLFLYTNADFLLGSNRLSEVRKVTYEDRDPPTAVKPTSTSSIHVYPNPTQDAIVVKNADCDVACVFGLNGQILITTSLYEGGGIINVSGLPMGTYLLLLNTELVKFIKQ